MGFGSDQQLGVRPPLLQKGCPEGYGVIALPSPESLSVGRMPVIEAIRSRRSLRQYSDEPLTMEELSFLLWATQGVRGISKGGVHTPRTVPSAGSRHPFETYVAVSRVADLEPGLYRYVPLSHQLCRLLSFDLDSRRRLIDAVLGQSFVGEAAVAFIWTAIPYRSEWRYSVRAHKVIALDAGHVCQSLYLSSEAVGAGACAIAAYDQELMDEFIGVDGLDEFTVYLAAVGKPRRKAL